MAHLNKTFSLFDFCKKRANKVLACRENWFTE